MLKLLFFSYFFFEINFNEVKFKKFELNYITKIMKLCFFIVIFSLTSNVILTQTPICYQESSIISPIGEINIGSTFESNLINLDSNKGIINLSFSPYKYSISELNLAKIVGFYKINNELGFGLRIKGNSSEIYREFAFSNSIVYKLNEIVTFGANLNYNYLTIKGFNSYNQINVDLSSRIKFDNNLSAGFKFENINRDKYSETTNIFQRFVAGLGYNFNQLYYFEIATNISLNHSSGLILGSKLILNKDFKCKIAIDTGYNDFELAMLYNTSEFDFIFGTVYNTTLGIKPNLELVYRW
jgi:hypothetical protein